ncbi:MAG: glycine/betaine/sarcosine/D-proline family reductase selenoprotein B [Ruthenibacterium sp.]
MALRAVHYINQFYAGLGGEETAGAALSVLDEIKGPALGLNRLWNGEMEVVTVLCCGDNYINEDKNYEQVKEQIREIVAKAKPDVFIAGPAFNAGRYGVACA